MSPRPQADVGSVKVQVRLPLAKATSGWRWVSTADSVEALQPSVLAVLETLLAVAGYLWIAHKWGTLHLTISACIAPLLLMRTKASGDDALITGVTWCRALQKRIESAYTPSRTSNAMDGPPFKMFRPGPPIVGTTALLFECISFACIAIAARVRAAIRSFMHHPLMCVASVPLNWWRIVGSIDSFRPPEVLPGIEDRQVVTEWGEDRAPIVDGMRPHVALRTTGAIFHHRSRTTGTPAAILTMSLLVPTYVLCFFVPAVAYRLAIKGNALLLAPLSWSIASALKGATEQRVRDLRDLEVFRVVRWVSGSILTLAAAKLVSMLSPATSEAIWSAFTKLSAAAQSDIVLRWYLVPDYFPPWQLFIIANSVLAFVVYWQADWAVKRYDRRVSLDEEALDIRLRWLLIVRRALTVLSITWTIYIAGFLSKQTSWPSPSAFFLIPGWI